MAMPTLALELQPLSASQKRLADEIDDSPRARGDVLVAEIADLDDGKLIAADAGHGVAILDQPLQARGDHAQQLVTLRVAEDLVDGLEAVEADVLDGDALTGLRHDGHRLADALLKARAVGQTRQRIDVRLLVGTRTRLLMLHGDGAKVDAHFDDLPFEQVRAARTRIVECEGSDDASRRLP